MKEIPSPLFPWKLLLVVAIGAAAVLLYADPMKFVFEKSDNALAGRMSGIHFEKGETGIIFFGNSLMNQALPIREDLLNAQLSEEFQKQAFPRLPIAAVEITTGGVNAWRLRGAADKLIAAKPSVIVVQSEMFMSRRQRQLSLVRLRNRLGTWSGLAHLQLFGHSRTQNTRVGVARNPGEGNPRPRQVKTDETLEVARDLWSNQLASPTSPEFLISREFVERVVRLGIQVVVVELPVSETAAKLSSEGYLHERTQTLEELTRFGVLHLVYPRILPDEYFRDYSHLNKKGRREFIQWFFPALAQALVKNDHVS